MAYVLHHTDAEILIKDTSNNKKKISVKLKNNNDFMPIDSCETTYPIKLIEKILSLKGPAWLCDEIMRDESPEYVEKHISYDVFGYVNQEQFKDKKILDFGCGSAGSTMVLSRMLPDTHITGVELVPKLHEIAKLRAEHYKVSDRVNILLSPSGSSLPKDIGTFDYIFLNAVYEHLLPEERDIVLPLLWRHLKPKGILFVNQTPYRWFPVETHTTNGLPFLNYLPDFIAGYYARQCSKRKLEDDSWSTLLRKGIRGGSAEEIIKILNNHSCSPILLPPNQLELKDRIDLWYVVSKKAGNLIIKKSLYHLFKLIKVTTGVIFLPSLSLAIEKSADVPD